MLRNTPRAVTSKQAIMADHTSLPSPTRNQNRPISPYLGSPRFFNGFLVKGLSDSESVMSPTSILDTKHFSNFGIPLGFDKNLPKPPTIFSENKHPHEKLDSKAIGLALIDETTNDHFSKPNSRMVLFGSKLKIQIPPIPPSAFSPADSPKSPADFGIKTIRNSQFLGAPSAFGTVNSGIQTKDSPPAATGGLSLSEMELSEDYTCVISHGATPKTTHIYDNCIVDSCFGGVGLSKFKSKYNSKSPSQNFLSFCYTCKNNLGEGIDIYMYRGEKAFCSPECRCKEMLIDGVKNSELDDTF